MKLQLYFPLKTFTQTQGFGENLADFYVKMGMLGHNGIDMVGWEGQVVRAAHNGTVTFAGEDGAAGLGVVVRSDEEFEDSEGKPSYWKSIYWHLKKDTIVVKYGQKVVVGDILAQCDNTGMSTGSHLHFGIKPCAKGENDWSWYNLEQNNGYLGAVDPKPYWTGFYAEDYRVLIPALSSLVELYKKLVEALKKK